MNIFTKKEKDTDSYEIDFDKVTTVEDCVILIKIMTQFNDLVIHEDAPFDLYNKLKHLAK